LGAFAILVDETKDTFEKEQLSFVLRFFDKDFHVYEHVLRCFHITKLTPQHFSDEIIKIVSANKLDINKCVAQCYDGASIQ